MEESLFPFVNRTVYDQRALVALNRLAEASVRKEKSRRTRALCYVCGVAGLVAGAFVYRYQAIVGQLLLLYGVLLLLVAISWRSFQLRSSKRQLQRGVTDCRYEFDEDEMLWRISALLRRSKSVSEHRLQIGSTTLDYNAFQVTEGGRTRQLTPKEFLLLYKFLSYPRKMFTKRQLLDEIWNMDSEVNEHTV